MLREGGKRKKQKKQNTHTHTSTHTNTRIHMCEGLQKTWDLGTVHMHRSKVWGLKEECEEACNRREERKTSRRERFFPATFEKREISISLVMVLLIEGGLAEEPRAALGCAGGKGHCLQHCIENNRDNSQDKTRQTQYKKSRYLQWFSNG